MPIHAAVLTLLLLQPVDAGAQGMSGVPQLSAKEIESARAACDELGRLPNPPMSGEACKAMMSLGTRLDAAASDLSARRPGDEAMTCEAIFAVGAALAAAWQARALGLATRQAAEQGPMRAQMNEAVLAGIGELGQSMQANPRFARLAQLGMNKGCEPPPDAPR